MKADNKKFYYRDLYITENEVSDKIVNTFRMLDDGEGNSGCIFFAMTEDATIEDAKKITKYLQKFGNEYGVVDIMETDGPCYPDGGDTPVGKYFMTNMESLKDVFSDYQIEMIGEFIECYHDTLPNFSGWEGGLMISYLYQPIRFTIKNKNE